MMFSDWPPRTSKRSFKRGSMLLSCSLLLVSSVAAVAAATHPDAVPRAAIATLDLPFIANAGQVDKRVAFYARTFAGTAFVTRHGALVLSLPGKARSRSHGVDPLAQARPGGRAPGWALVETPVSQASLHPSGRGLSSTGVSIFHGANSGNAVSRRRSTMRSRWDGPGRE